MKVLCVFALVLASVAALPGNQGKFIFPETKADASVEVRAKLRGLAATENRYIDGVCMCLCMEIHIHYNLQVEFMLRGKANVQINV